MAVYRAVAAEDQNCIQVFVLRRDADGPLDRGIALEGLELTEGRSESEDGCGAHFRRTSVAEIPPRRHREAEVGPKVRAQKGTRTWGTVGSCGVPSDHPRSRAAHCPPNLGHGPLYNQRACPTSLRLT